MNVPKAMSAAQSSMFGAFTRFVCYIKPEPGSKSYSDDMDRLIEVKYRRAFLLYEAQHWDEAAVAFRQIAYDYIDHEQAIIAAKMYFDSEARVLQYSDPERPACRANMFDEVDKLRQSFCDENRVKARLKGDAKKTEEFMQSSEGLCTSLKGAYSYLKAQKLLQCVKDAQASGQTSRFGECAKGFEDLGLEVCEAEKSLIGKANYTATTAVQPVARGGGGLKKPVEENNCSKDGSVFFYNAATYYQKASKIKSAMDLRKKILDTEMWKERKPTALHFSTLPKIIAALRSTASQPTIMSGTPRKKPMSKSLRTWFRPASFKSLRPSTAKTTVARNAQRTKFSRSGWKTNALNRLWTRSSFAWVSAMKKQRSRTPTPSTASLARRRRSRRGKSWSRSASTISTRVNGKKASSV